MVGKAKEQEAVVSRLGESERDIQLSRCVLPNWAGHLQYTHRAAPVQPLGMKKPP